MSALSTTRTAPAPPPARVVLGPEAWVVLLEQAAGVRLPDPFGRAAGPELTDDARRLALEQLRASPLVTGSDDPLVPDLHPSIQATLTAAAAPQLRVAAAVRRGDVQEAALVLLAGPLAAGLRRTLTDDGSDRLLLGPVELSTLLLEHVAQEVVAAFGETGGAEDRQGVRVDAVASIAAVRALEAGREPLAGAALSGAALSGAAPPGPALSAPVPAALRAIAGGVEAVARVDVTTARNARVLLWVRTADGWWRVRTSSQDVVLAPVDRDGVLTDLASALTGALLEGAT